MFSARFAFAALAATQLIACADAVPQQSVDNLTEGGSVVAVDATSDAEEAFLGDVWSVRIETMLDCPPTGPCEGSGTDVRVLEVAPPGGDPATNGTSVVVNLDRAGRTRTFDTGLDVLSVTDIRSQILAGMDLERVFISVVESTYDDATASFGSQENEYFIEFSADEGVQVALYDTNVLPDPEARTPLSASDDPQYGLVPFLWAVHTTAVEGLTVRAFEIAGGDPAYNGTSVIVSAFDYDAGALQTWNTGLNVRHVERVQTTSHDTFEIVTEADVPLSNGEMVTGPIVYPAKMERTESGLSNKLLIDLLPPVG